MIPPGGVFDAHVDTILRADSPQAILDGSPDLHFDVPRAAAAGVKTVVTAICAEAAKDQKAAVRKGLDAWRALQGFPGMSFLLGMEGCEPVAAGLVSDEDLEEFSIAGLTWNGMNSLGGGIGTDEGLTRAGRELARRLLRTGIVIDVSHLCDRSRADLLSTGIPVVASHCNCRTLCDIPRNLPDDDIREIARQGGVVGLTFVPAFLGPDADIAMLVDHVRHAVDVAGIAHVGFGSDFDGVGDLPGGIPGCEAWPAVMDGLRAGGFSEMDANRLAGANWRRVFNEMRGSH